MPASATTSHHLQHRKYKSRYRDGGIATVSLTISPNSGMGWLRFFRQSFPCLSCCQTPIDQWCEVPKCVVANVPAVNIEQEGRGHRIDVVVNNNTFHDTTEDITDDQEVRSVRFVCVSDTHGLHSQIPQMPNDPTMILLHTGDFSNSDGDYTAFNTWLGTLPYTEKIVLAGNHEIKLSIDPTKARAELTNATHYMCGNTITVRGVSLFGSPHHPQRGCCYKKEAFGANAKKRELLFSTVPDGVHIIASHCPPFGIRDEEFLVDSMAHVGCGHLLTAVQRTKPRCVVFGHCHQHRGASRLWHTDTMEDEERHRPHGKSSLNRAKLSESKVLEEVIEPASVEVELTVEGRATYRRKSSPNATATLLINAASLGNEDADEQRNQVAPPIIIDMVLHRVTAAEKQLVGLV